MTGETIFTMHHPNGAVKKTQAGIHDGGSISGFDYAGGSSGSALFDINGQLVGGPLSSGAGCSVSYAPVAPIKVALSNPPVPAVPLDVMVVFDRSGSMASPAPPVGRTKLEEAQDASALFVQLVREGQGDRLGLVTLQLYGKHRCVGGSCRDCKARTGWPSALHHGKDRGDLRRGRYEHRCRARRRTSGLRFRVRKRSAMLLMTDGLQNTLPMIEEIEGYLGPTRLSVIGFGSDADIDAPLLNRLARDHGGHFTRATDGLALRKFFGLCFGNIFESGALSDPEFVLRSNQAESAPHRVRRVRRGADHPGAGLGRSIDTPAGAYPDAKRNADQREARQAGSRPDLGLLAHSPAL